jgi:hypothetical protein
MQNVSDFVVGLTSERITRQEAGQAQELFKLALTLKCLSSESLEKRVDGLKLINDLIDMAVRRETPRGMSGVMSRNHPVTQWLDSTYLLSWIHSKHVIDQLFDGRMHNQLVSRAQCLFTFLAQKRALTAAHLDLLWESSLGKKRDTIVASIYNIFTKLVNYLSAGDLLKLMALIDQLPVDEVDRQTLVLLRTLTQAAFMDTRTTTEEQDAGLTIFWKVLTSEQTSVQDQHTALEFLADILEQSFGAQVWWSSYESVSLFCVCTVCACRYCWSFIAFLVCVCVWCVCVCFFVFFLSVVFSLTPAFLCGACFIGVGCFVFVFSKDLKVAYVVKCLDNLVESQRAVVPQTLLLLRRIIHSFPESNMGRSKTFSKSSLIDRVEGLRFPSSFCCVFLRSCWLVVSVFLCAFQSRSVPFLFCTLFVLV